MQFQGGTVYPNLARNRSFIGNLIYSPSPYLLFSLEYLTCKLSDRGLPAGSNVIGIAAGSKL